MAFTLAKMKDFAIEAWGPSGGDIVNSSIEVQQAVLRRQVEAGSARPYAYAAFREAPCLLSYNPGTH